MSQGDLVTISLMLMAASSVINTMIRLLALVKKDKPVKAGQGTIHLGGRL